MAEIGQPVIASDIAETVDGAVRIQSKLNIASAHNAKVRNDV